MSEEGGRDLVEISDQTRISFHELQDIYNTLTGKFERISQPFERDYLVNFEDLRQLNERLSQCCDSYGAQVKNDSVTVYHVDGPKEVFSSFERFRLYNTSNSNPVENVSLEYNIIIIPAGTKKPVTYRIRVNMVSRAGLREK